MNTKRILLTLMLLVGVAHFSFFDFQISIGEAYAQSMTDEQVIQFVMKEQAAGSNQQAIVQKLLQKGVTPEQLRARPTRATAA